MPGQEATSTERKKSDSDKSSSQRIPLRELPMDVWWNVLDELESDLNALVACALVCRGWAERSQRLIGTQITFDSRSDVRWIAKRGRNGLQGVKSCRRVEMRVFADDLSLRALGVFATMFAGKMPNLKMLTIRRGQWRTEEMHVDVFHYLSAFASITSLNLYSTRFPSVTTFGRLVSALPSLTALHCYWINGEGAFDSRNLSLGAFLRRPRSLATLRVTTYDLDTMRGICDFLVATEMASTLKNIIVSPLMPNPLNELGKSGIPALLSSAAASIHSLDLSFDVKSLPVAGAPAIDFSKFVNLEHVDFAVHVSYRNDDENILHLAVSWICDWLTGPSNISTALRTFTLRLPIYAQFYPQDDAASQRYYEQHCKVLDDTLSPPPFKGLERFIFEFETYKTNATSKAELERLAPKRFPKLAARGIFDFSQSCCNRQSVWLTFVHAEANTDLEDP